MRKLLATAGGGVAALVLLASAAAVLVSTSDTSPTAISLPLYCEQEPTSAACAEVRRAVAAQDPHKAVEAVTQAMRSDPGAVDNCHGLLHYVGSVFASDLAQEEEAWLEMFPACGYGLLHGVYERLPLPPSIKEVPPFLRDSCNMGSTAIDGACAHALGHDLVAHWPGQVEITTQACAQSFTSEPASTALKVDSCQVGVLMEEAQRAIRSVEQPKSSAEVTHQWLDGLADMCQELPHLEKWCPGSFVSAVSYLDAAATQTFLQWCNERYPIGGLTCATWAGEHLGMRPTLGPELVDGCTGEYALACKAALFDGARSVNTQGLEASDGRVCTLLTIVKDPNAHLLCSVAQQAKRESVAAALGKVAVEPVKSLSR